MTVPMGSREQVIEALVKRLTEAIPNAWREVIVERYVPAFYAMTECEFLIVKEAILRTHDSRQLTVVDNNLHTLIYGESDYRVAARYIAFCFDTILWGLWFTVENLPYELTNSTIVDSAQNFFDPKHAVLTPEVLATDEWVNYSIGYMMESMVKQNSRCTHSSPEHLKWLSQNVRALAPHRETITSRFDVSREFCDALLNNPSPAIEDGIL